MKKILLIADAQSSHTQKWAEAVKALGFDVMIFSFTVPLADQYLNTNIKLATDQNLVKNEQFNQSDLRKSSYIKHLRQLKVVIKEFKPDLVHAHYATSYGLMAALSGFRPFIISVWGSDVFDFPNRSFFHNRILRFNLKNAECIVSSSKIMADETRKYFKGKVEVIPFGIDLNKYKRTTSRGKSLTIGIIKSMEDHYGIEDLILAFKIVREKYSDIGLKLLLIGGGTKLEKYRDQVSRNGLEKFVELRGKIPQQDVPSAHNEIDIFVNPSVHESFGVSVLEASATENPVIVTNVGGLKEVVVDHYSGLIVEQGSVGELVKAISHFIENRELIDIFGKNGRQFVTERYNLKNGYDQIHNLYLSFLK